MRLLTRPTRRIKGKVYKTWYVTLRIKTVDELGWSWGQYLDTEVNGDALIIRPRSQPQNASAMVQTDETEDASDGTKQ